MIRNFFLADDDQDDKELFEEALRNIDNHIEFHTAPNGKELINQLFTANVEPEIIFLDINMPELDGWESLKKIQQDDRLRTIPVVMYSTSAMVLDGNKAIKAGAVCYLEKPPSFIKLKDFLEKIIVSSKDGLIDTLKTIEASKTHNLLVA
ncbi:response regulator [Niastella caeni]|uniref:Response regulator n=1 Tax=Niastella caeni TaxID=2569763 RepID=A0A4S8HZH6_9BACT|nr:response regulator [Niastella caeni]THU40249.1 response regulator [Niastella caeni]